MAVVEDERVAQIMVWGPVECLLSCADSKHSKTRKNSEPQIRGPTATQFPACLNFHVNGYDILVHHNDTKYSNCNGKILLSGEHSGIGDPHAYILPEWMVWI